MHLLAYPAKSGENSTEVLVPQSSRLRVPVQGEPGTAHRVAEAAVPRSRPPSLGQPHPSRRPVRRVDARLQVRLRGVADLRGESFQACDGQRRAHRLHRGRRLRDLLVELPSRLSIRSLHIVSSEDAASLVGAQAGVLQHLGVLLAHDCEHATHTSCALPSSFVPFAHRLLVPDLTISKSGELLLQSRLASRAPKLL